MGGNTPLSSAFTEENLLLTIRGKVIVVARFHSLPKPDILTANPTSPLGKDIALYQNESVANLMCCILPKKEIRGSMMRS